MNEISSPVDWTLVFAYGFPGLCVVVGLYFLVTSLRKEMKRQRQLGDKAGNKGWNPGNSGGPSSRIPDAFDTAERINDNNG
jgi:hypothetical protein